MSKDIFLSVSERVQVTSDVVHIRDVASIYTAEQSIKKLLEKQVLFEYGKNEIVETRQVVSTLYIIKTMEHTLNQTLMQIQAREQKQKKTQNEVQNDTQIKAQKQMDDSATSDYTIVPITSNDCIVERIAHSNQASKQKENITTICKIIVTCLLCLIGGAFSIMAFHNDVGLNDIFSQFYELVTGEKSSGFTILEISYSIGLMSGIIIFYDHIGKRRISKDPTPIEVSMRTYEQEMNQAMMQSWEREGKKIDVE